MNKEDERFKYCCSIEININRDWIGDFKKAGLTDNEIRTQGIILASNFRKLGYLILEGSIYDDMNDAGLLNATR